MLRICVKFAIEAVVDLRQSIGDNSHSQTGNQSQQPQHFAALEGLCSHPGILLQSLTPQPAIQDKKQ